MLRGLPGRAAGKAAIRAVFGLSNNPPLTGVGNG